MWGPWLAPGSPESHLARVRTRERRNHDDAGAKPAVTADPRRPKKQSDEDPRVTLLMLGDPAPWFTAPTPSNPEFVFDTAAGRYVLLVFLARDDAPANAKALRALAVHRQQFDDEKLSAFVVVRDPG